MRSPREAGATAPQRAVRPLRALPLLPLRIADVALTSTDGDAGTLIEARATWARTTGALEHHVIVPCCGLRAER